MKKSMIIFLSVLAMTLTFSGCGGSEGSVTNSIGSDTNTNNESNTASQGEDVIVIDNGDVSLTTITNEFGLNPSLGTPPPLPSS